MNKNTKKISILVPCFNEEVGVASVISSVPIEKLKQNGYKCEILVVDNNSTDKTTEVAKSLGARVINEPKKGKGNAVRTGLYNISNDTDFVVMLDGDNTYRPEEVLRLVDMLVSGFASVVLGSRLYGKVVPGSMHPFNMFGNYLFSFLVRSLYRVSVTDVLTGYYAWTRSAVLNLRPHLVSEGFTIEMEMITKMAKLGEQIYSVPVSYEARMGESNLSPITDGVKILKVLLQNIFWRVNKADFSSVSSVDILQNFTQA